MNTLADGFSRFRRDIYPQRSDLFHSLEDGQAPHTLFIGCSDSRVIPELITQAEPGSVFVMRNPGNIVPTYSDTMDPVAAAIEYAVTGLKVQHLVICGHSNCGAMTAVAEKKDLAGLPAVGAWLGQILHLAHNSAQDEPCSARTLAERNVIAQLGNVWSHPAVARALLEDSLTLHGWIYDIGRGDVLAFDGRRSRFVRLAEHPHAFVHGTRALAEAA